MYQGFIKGDKLLMETSKVDDLFNLDRQIKSFSALLDSINKSGSFGFIGPFGSGKSTLIENVRRSRVGREEEELWIEFEAWKFPERRDLWESFVLEFSKQIDSETFFRARNKIDGSSGAAGKSVLNAVSSIANVFAPGAGLLNNLGYLFETSPVKRVFEIQEILFEIIRENESKDIFIIIEDIDRSGDSGVYFLETLKNFFDNLDVKNKLIAVVPMENKAFEEKKDSFLKCLNFVEYFDYRKPKLINFVNEVFDQSFIIEEVQKNQIVSFLESLFFIIPEMSPRLLKFILRKANFNFKINIEDKFSPDFRISILIEASKYVRSEAGNTFFNRFKTSGIINKSSIFGKFLWTIMEDMPSMYNHDGIVLEPPKDFKILNNLDHETPINNTNKIPPVPNKFNLVVDDKNNTQSLFIIPDFYFN